MVNDIPSKLVIVVVEDNEPIAELIKDTLSGETEYQVVLVHNGASALEAIRSVKANLILLDVNLPGLGGFEIYDMLQEDETARTTPVLFMTAGPHTNEFRKRRIKEYLPKPFDLDQLLSKVAKALKS